MSWKDVLKVYTEITYSYRKMKNQFIVPGGIRKGLAASTRTLALGLVKVTQGAFLAKVMEPPNYLRAHSSRGTAASSAEFRGLSSELICKAVTWSTFSTSLAHFKVDPKALSQ